MGEVSAKNFRVKYVGSRMKGIGPVCTDCEKLLEALEDCMQRPRIVYLRCRLCDRLWWAARDGEAAA